jgi:hypothetical protein
MTDSVARLWWHFLGLSKSFGGIARVSLSSILVSLRITDNAFQVAVKYLAAIEAMAFLSREEIVRIASGEGVSGEIISVLEGDDWRFIRINSPHELYVRLGARLSLKPSEVDYDILDVESIIAAIGLSPENLEDARSFEFTHGDFETLLKMPEDFFPRCWKRMEDLGNATELRRIAAFLANYGDLRAPQLAEIARCRASLKQTLKFVEMAVEMGDRATGSGCESRRSEIAPSDN